MSLDSHHKVERRLRSSPVKDAGRPVPTASQIRVRLRRQQQAKLTLAVSSLGLLLAIGFRSLPGPNQFASDADSVDVTLPKPDVAAVQGFRHATRVTSHPSGSPGNLDAGGTSSRSSGSAQTDDSTGSTEDSATQTSRQHAIDDSAPDGKSYQIVLGDQLPSGWFPLLLVTSDQSTALAGFYEPIRVERQPVWNLEPSLVAEIDQAWSEAGYCVHAVY